MKWKIVYYKTTSGKFPVKELIDKLNEKAQAKVSNTFDLLVEFGTKLGLPHSKKVMGTSLWELRILGEKALRFFYIAKVGKEFLILHAFVKKQQKTPKKEIKTAISRLNEYQRRS